MASISSIDLLLEDSTQRVDHFFHAPLAVVIQTGAKLWKNRGLVNASLQLAREMDEITMVDLLMKFEQLGRPFRFSQPIVDNDRIKSSSIFMQNAGGTCFLHPYFMRNAGGKGLTCIPFAAIL